MTRVAHAGCPQCGAAERFARERLGTALESLPRGREGLARLADAIDAWREIEDPGDDADRAFVEGAGGLLGLLLIDHVGDGDHVERGGVHRVRLGPRGWFDPFAAVEEALDADDPRAALAARVREAESEARDRGRTSRVLYALDTALRERLPDARVAERFEHYVRLDPDVELDLARVVATTDGQPDEAVARAVEKLVSMVSGAGATEVPWDEARARLLPRPVSATFVEELARAYGTGTLLVESVAADVHLAFVLAYDDRARYVRTAEAELWECFLGDRRRGNTAQGKPSVIPETLFPRGLSSRKRAVYSTALANLATRSASARFARVDTADGPLVVARTGDGLDAARLVLPTLHDVLAPELGSPFLAAVPHRDTLLACAREPASLVHALRARARDDAARAPHRISEALFEISPSGIARAG